MSEVLIKVDHLSKKFCRSLKRSMYYGVTDTLKTMAGVNYSTDTLRPSEFWSLNDISFELRKGETLGILGANGSGKSTLLRLLAGIFPPDHGKIEIYGNIGALIAVGAGFHPHMTGYENIYLNGTILGLTKDRIDEIINDITDFSEIPEDALNAPVATYSSGMKVRLGFSVAMHCEPDILLVDEVLSVGDIGFKNKAVRKMNEFREKANGLIFISHDLEQMRMLCDRVIVLDNGKCVFEGDTEKSCNYYESLIRNNQLKISVKNSHFQKKISDFKSSFENEKVIVLDVGIMNKGNEKITDVHLNEELIVFVEFKTTYKFKNLSFNVPIIRESHPFIYCIDLWSYDNDKIKLENLNPGRYRLVIRLEKHNLNPSIYNFGTITVRDNKSYETYTKIKFNRPFNLVSGSFKAERGFINVNDSWKITRLNTVEFKPQYREKFDKLKKLIEISNPLIVEIGAHFGEDSYRLIKTFDNAFVHSIEPDPRNISIFKKHVKSKQIKLHEIALSNIEGEMDFYQSYSESNENVPEKYDWIKPSDYIEKKLNNSGSSSLKKGYENILQKKIKVPVMRYDNWCNKNNIGLVDFVWIDVQGAERDVLLGMGSKLINIKYIMLEYGEIVYEDAMTREETIVFMNKNNFELIKSISSIGAVGDLMFINTLI
ncbi:FkbM family methyltransferase [Flavobacteriaceae bacterium]|nr:FkbM family methyltransferase [Flavobacteriaceae bacterium]